MLSVPSSSCQGVCHTPVLQLRRGGLIRLHAAQPMAWLTWTQLKCAAQMETPSQMGQRLMQEARAQDCCMLFLPECFSFIGLNQDEVCKPSIYQLCEHCVLPYILCKHCCPLAYIY